MTSEQIRSGRQSSRLPAAALSGAIFCFLGYWAGMAVLVSYDRSHPDFDGLTAMQWLLTATIGAVLFAIGLAAWAVSVQRRSIMAWVSLVLCVGELAAVVAVVLSLRNLHF